MSSYMSYNFTIKTGLNFKVGLRQLPRDIRNVGLVEAPALLLAAITKTLSQRHLWAKNVKYQGVPLNLHY